MTRWARREMPRPGPSDDPDRCAYCGSQVTLESVEVQRPGRPDVVRVYKRCRSRSIERNRGCPTDIVSETELP